MMMKCKGYNTNSGLLYTIQGLSQYKSRPLPVNKYDTADFVNKKLEKQNITTDAELSVKTVKKVERELEQKEDPSKGTAKYRIENKEKSPMKAEVMVIKDNYESEPTGVETNLYLK